MNYYNKTIQDLTVECHDHMAQNNLPCPTPIIADGRIKRYSTKERGKRKDEWYVAYESIFNDKTYFTCIYGSWCTGEQFTFKSYDASNISDQERKLLDEEYARRKKEADRNLKELQDKAAEVAKRLWREASDTPPSSDYLFYPQSKGIRPIGAKFIPNSTPERIIIPLKNTAGEIRSMQSIFRGEDGKICKRFLQDGEKRGNFHTLGELKNGDPIHVVEGWATGVSVYTTGIGTVVIAYDAYNISPVVEKLRGTFPQREIIIAGDNDDVGRQKAGEAAKDFGCRTVFPEFTENNKADAEGKAYTDFNDLHQICGLEEVKKQLQGINTELPATQDELKKLAQTLLTKEDPCTDFSIASLPTALREYIEAICKTTNADPMMVTMAALTTVSAFLGKRVSYPHYFQPLHTNVWMLAIAKSGQFKSTALNKGSSLAWKQHAKVVAEIKEVEHRIRTTSDANAKLELEEERLSLSLRDVILPTKITGEALLEHLSQGHTGVILASEFGAFLQNLAKNHNNDLKSLFTDLYDVPPAYRYKTRNQGDLILEKPCFSICGVSTLTWVQENIKTNDVASGFFARFLIFTPVHRSEIPPALPSLETINFDDEENRLLTILKQVDTPHTFNPLTAEAKLFFEAIHEKIYKMHQEFSSSNQEILEPYLKRWSPYLLKLAMVMQIIEDPLSKDISAKAMLAAIGIIFAAIKSTSHLFGEELNESEHESKCRKVFEWICKQVKTKGKPVRRQSIFSSRQADKRSGKPEYDAILNTLQEQGKVICNKPKGVNMVDWLYWPNTQQVEDS